MALGIGLTYASCSPSMMSLIGENESGYFYYTFNQEPGLKDTSVKVQEFTTIDTEF